MWNPQRKRKWEDGKAKPERFKSRPIPKPVEVKPKIYEGYELQEVWFDEAETMTRTIGPREFEKMLRYAESYGRGKRDVEERIIRALQERELQRRPRPNWESYEPKDFAPAPPENTEIKTYLVQFIGGPKNAFQEYHKLPYIALKEGRWNWRVEGDEHYIYELAIIPVSKTSFSDHPILIAIFIPNERP